MCHVELSVVRVDTAITIEDVGIRALGNVYLVVLRVLINHPQDFRGCRMRITHDLTSKIELRWDASRSTSLGTHFSLRHQQRVVVMVRGGKQVHGVFVG